MPLAAFCTTADLILAAGSEAELARMARDRGSASDEVTDADVQARLAVFIENASLSIRSRLKGTVDTDSPPSGSELEANLRRWAVDGVFEQLYDYLDHVGEANPYSARVRRNIREQEATAKGQQSIGAPPAPAREGWSSTQDSDTTYTPAAEGGNGTSSDLLARW